MEEERYACSLCHTFSAKSMSTVLRHIGSVHAHEPNFHTVCGVNGCSRAITTITPSESICCLADDIEIVHFMMK